MSITATQQEKLARATDCEIRFDNLTRQLYATDASIYQIEPVGVAFPRSVAQAASVFRAAADAGVSIIPRGAATGLVGGAIGDGLVTRAGDGSLAVTPLGRLLVRNVAMAFDAYLPEQKTAGRPMFSKTV